MSGQNNGNNSSIYDLYQAILQKQAACEVAYRKPLNEYDQQKRASAGWDKAHPVLSGLRDLKHSVVVAVAEHNIEHECRAPAQKAMSALGSQVYSGLFR